MTKAELIALIEGDADVRAALRKAVVVAEGRRLSDSLRQRLLGHGEKGILEHAQLLQGLFARANRSALESALKAVDFKAACKALHLGEESFTAILNDGHRKAIELAMKYPDLVKEAMKRPKKH